VKFLTLTLLIAINLQTNVVAGDVAGNGQGNEDPGTVSGDVGGNAYESESPIWQEAKFIMNHSDLVKGRYAPTDRVAELASRVYQLYRATEMTPKQTLGIDLALSDDPYHVAIRVPAKGAIYLDEGRMTRLPSGAIIEAIAHHLIAMLGAETSEAGRIAELLGAPAAR